MSKTKQTPPPPALSCVAVVKLQSEGPNTAGIKTLSKIMLESLVKRLAKVEESEEAVVACLLDPRYK